MIDSALIHTLIMALEIKTLDNAFTLEGSLNKHNVAAFKQHFKDVFKTKNRVVINIDKLDEVDRVGVLAIENLYKRSIQQDKQLLFSGIGARDMYEHLKSVG